MQLTEQECQALKRLLNELSDIQHKAFNGWSIVSKETVPDVCESMQDVSYFLNKLENTNAK